MQVSYYVTRKRQPCPLFLTFQNQNKCGRFSGWKILLKFPKWKILTEFIRLRLLFNNNITNNIQQLSHNTPVNEIHHKAELLEEIRYSYCCVTLQYCEEAWKWSPHSIAPPMQFNAEWHLFMKALWRMLQFPSPLYYEHCEEIKFCFVCIV